MNKTTKKLKILFVTTEAKPFVAAGGLGAVMHALPLALSKLGHDARIFVPRYLQIDPKVWNLKSEYDNLRVPTGNETGPKELICNVKKYDPDKPDTSVPAYFLENMEYYEQRANVYGYADDSTRWVLLCRGVLEFLKVSSWFPDVIVVTDCHSGFLPNILHTFYKGDAKLAALPVVHSIHNLAHQVDGRHELYLPPEERDDGHSILPAMEDPRLLKANGTKRGILFADIVNTVSQTYAKEITTPEYGEGLEAILQRKFEEKRLYGILNGLEYGSWNPKTDKLLTQNYGIENLELRGKNKAALQREFKMKIGERYFMMAIVSRLVKQKGFDLIEPFIFQLMKDFPIQLVVVGEGESGIMDLILKLKKTFPGRVGAKLSFDLELPHKIYAAADVILIPSRFEPSGLTQMEAMVYGCVPIVRKTGGLADTVVDFDPQNESGTGFVFEDVDSMSFMAAITRAYQSWQHKSDWNKLQKRAMQKDFSWENAARQYEGLFSKAINLKKKNQKNPNA